MARFTVKEGDRPEDCFVFDEDTQAILVLRPPQTHQHAQEVAAFLRAHVANVDLQLLFDSLEPPLRR